VKSGVGILAEVEGEGGWDQWPVAASHSLGIVRTGGRGGKRGDSGVSFEVESDPLSEGMIVVEVLSFYF